MSKRYKFKNVKQSVTVKIIHIDTDVIYLENTDYKGLYYTVKSMDELEEVKDD